MLIIHQSITTIYKNSLVFTRDNQKVLFLQDYIRICTAPKRCITHIREIETLNLSACCTMAQVFTLLLELPLLISVTTRRNRQTEFCPSSSSK